MCSRKNKAFGIWKRLSCFIKWKYEEHQNRKCTEQNGEKRQHRSLPSSFKLEILNEMWIEMTTQNFLMNWNGFIRDVYMIFPRSSALKLDLNILKDLMKLEKWKGFPHMCFAGHSDFCILQADSQSLRELK